MLDGSGSSDADGDHLTYGWTLTAAPIGSNAILPGSTSALASFVADLAGLYAVELVVNDGTEFSVADQVAVTAMRTSTETEKRPVTDPESDPDTDPVTVTSPQPENDQEANAAPLAQDDSVNTTKSIPIQLALVFTDPDGPGPYTFSIVSSPRSGVLSGDGALRTYSPNPWFNGSDSFQWSVNDGQTASNVATMTITIDSVNLAPVAQDDAYATLRDTPLNVGLINGVLANDSDANGDLLTAMLVAPPPAASGVLTFNGNGTLVFVPAVGFAGTVEFSYVADDGPMVSNTAVVTIVVTIVASSDVAAEFDPPSLQPTNGKTNVSVNPTLEIGCSVAATTAAQYQIATGSAFTTMVYDSGENFNDVCSHLAFAGLNTLTTYFWRGRAKDALGVWTPWSQPSRFTTVDTTPVFTNVFQDGNDGYSGAGDADIRGSALDPTQVIREWNQGAQDVLRTGRRLPNQPTDEIYRSLLQFQIAGLSNPDAVINAYIELTGWHHTDSNHLFNAYNSMYELYQPWAEGAGIKDVDAKAGEVSWTYSARPAQWAIPGAASASDTDPIADRSETALVHMVASNQDGNKAYWSSQDLVEVVKGWISNPASNHGVLIKADDETLPQTLHRASRENPDMSFRPKLVIVSTESIHSLPNQAPVAQELSVSTGLNRSLDLLLAYTDPDGPSPYAFAIVTPPSHGALTGSGANRTYTPDADFIGSDSFTWRMNDGQSDSNLATVSITITETAALFVDNFDRADSSALGQGWVEVEQAGATAVIIANKLQFADTSDKPNRPLVRRSFGPVSDGAIQWDFDFDWARTSADAGCEFWMQLGDSTLMVNPSNNATQSTGVGVNLRWGSFNNIDQSLVARQDATQGGPTSLAVISGPAHLSVTADLSARTYSVSINGTLVGSGLSFDSLGTVSTLDSVRFFTNNLNEQNFSGRTIDNLSIFTALAGSTPPAAAAGPDQSVPVGATVALDGGESTGNGGDALTYSWTLTASPVGSTAGLTGSAASSASFVPDLAGLYQVELVVSNGTDDSAPDTVNIIALEGSIILLSDSFDRADSSVVGEAWVELQAAGATVSIAGNQLLFDDTSDVLYRPLVSRGFSPVASGSLQWDFDFDWARTGTDTGYELWMQLGDSAMMVNPTSNLDQFDGVGVNLRWGSFSNVHQNLVARQDTTLGGPTAIAIVSGPARVSVRVDLSARTYSVAIDGGEVRSGLFFDDLDVEKLDTVRLFTYNLNETSFAGRTFDNVVISRE
jgi:hypothetical protein